MDKKMKVIIGISVIILIAIMATVAFLAMTVLGMKESSLATSGNSSSKKVAGATEIIDLGDAITVNILGEQKDQHIIRVVMSFEVNKKDKGYKKFMKDFEDKNVMIRDEIIQVISEQTFEMMTRGDAKQKLKSEIASRINKLLDTEVISQVYFGEFFVQ